MVIHHILPKYNNYAIQFTVQQAELQMLNNATELYLIHKYTHDRI